MWEIPIPHSWKDCPAKDAECRKCHRRGHFSAVCQSKQMHEVSEEEQKQHWDSICLEEVRENNAGWHSDIKLNGEVVSFTLDTGAAVTAIPTRQNIVIE
jgi:hypothetical protein